MQTKQSRKGMTVKQLTCKFHKEKTYFQARNTFLSALNISCWQNDMLHAQFKSCWCLQFPSGKSFQTFTSKMYKSSTKGQILWSVKVSSFCHLNKMHIVQHLSACLLQKISLIPIINAMSLLSFIIPLNGVINEETGKSNVCFFMHL